MTSRHETARHLLAELRARGTADAAEAAERLQADHHAREMALLSQDVYDAALQAGAPPPGWTRATADIDALRDIEGVTVLIYDQTCATEKRRRRKRGTVVDPARFAYINDLVCEGCGDCSVESNCLSVEPKETPFGRKRNVSPALRAYAALTTNAARGAVREVGKALGLPEDHLEILLGHAPGAGGRDPRERVVELVFMLLWQGFDGMLRNGVTGQQQL